MLHFEYNDISLVAISKILTERYSFHLHHNIIQQIMTFFPRIIFILSLIAGQTVGLIVAGVVVAVLLMAVVAIFLYRRDNRHGQMDLDDSPTTRPEHNAQSLNIFSTPSSAPRALSVTGSSTAQYQTFE